MSEPKKKVGTYKDNCIYSLKSLPEWRHWLHRMAAKRGVHASEIVSRAIEEWARNNGEEPPPERWKAK
jgi:hypothetical protein